MNPQSISSASTASRNSEESRRRRLRHVIVSTQGSALAVLYPDRATDRESMSLLGKLVIARVDEGTFRIGTLTRVFIAPEGVRLDALDGANVRIEVDPMGRVLEIAASWQHRDGRSRRDTRDDDGAAPRTPSL